MIRKIIDSVIAKPIPAVSSIVIITCAMVLFNRITSDAADNVYHEADTTSVSKPYVDRNIIQHEVNQPYREDEDNVTNAGVNNVGRFQAKPENTKRSRNYSTNNSDDVINSSGFNNTDNQLKSSENDVSTQTTINQTNISFPAGFVDTGSSNTISNTIDNTSSSVSENGTNTATDTSDNTEISNEVVDTTESEYPATSEHTVQIDLDETQTISCRPIVENGPSCMCTLTTTDASGTDVEVMNNCGS